MGSKRAQQFMPFAALKGYYDMIAERERVKEEKRELSEDQKELLTRKFQQLEKGMMVRVTYYDKDAYTTIEGLLAKIDWTFERLIVVKTEISMLDIYEVEFVEV